MNRTGSCLVCGHRMEEHTGGKCTVVGCTCVDGHSSICECGHPRSTHIAGTKECTIPGCKCGIYHDVTMEKAVQRTCFHCGIKYHCSHPSKAKEGVCNTCRKQIEDNYQHDLMTSLFGYKDDLIARLKAQVLAMKMKEAGVTVGILWNYFNENK